MVMGIVYKLIGEVTLANILSNICDSAKVKSTDSNLFYFLSPVAPCLGPEAFFAASMRAFLHVSACIGKPVIGFYDQKVDRMRSKSNAFCIYVYFNIIINTLGKSCVLSARC